MSEAQKPVEEPVAAPTTETPAVEPVTESKPVEETPAPATETATETPAETAPATTEEAAPVKEEPKPIEEGILGYKGPGLIKYVLSLLLILYQIHTIGHRQYLLVQTCFACLMAPQVTSRHSPVIAACM